MCETDADLEQVGGGCPGLGPDILDSGSFINVVRFRDVGDDTVH